MRETKGYLGLQYQGIKVRADARVVPNQLRGSSVSPQLLVIAASLGLWAIIIAACTAIIT